MLRIVLCLMAGLIAFSARTADAFTLVKSGEPKAVIVVPAEMGKDETAGVDDLVEFVEKMSGAKLAVLKEGEPVPEKMDVIRVGKALAKPVESVLSKVADSSGGFVIAARGGVLYLAGQTPLATSFACTELLERLGCRWYIPGELGEVYPVKRTLKFGGRDIVDKPDYDPRWLRVDRIWSRRNKLGSQLAKVVDLTVERDPNRFVFIGKRLPAAIQIDDRQSPVAKADVLVQVHACTIGTTVGQRLVHSRQLATIDRRSIDIQNARDSTHSGSNHYSDFSVTWIVVRLISPPWLQSVPWLADVPGRAVRNRSQ